MKIFILLTVGVSLVYAFPLPTTGPRSKDGALAKRVILLSRMYSSPSWVQPKPEPPLPDGWTKTRATDLEGNPIEGS